MPTSAPPFQSLHHLSPHVTPLSPCSCLHCMGTDDFGVQIPSLQSAKYLLHRTPDCNYRYLQAMGAFRSLFPVFTNPSLPSRRKLQVYAQIVLAILFYGSESQVFTLAQITGFNSLHYMVLRQIFQVKSSHYHRVLHPSQEDCSNEYLLSLTYRHAPRLLIPSQPISVQRLRFLGHILRHFEALEHRIISHTSHIGLKLLSQKLFAVLSNLEEISIPPPKKLPIQCTPQALSPWFTYILDLPLQTGMIPLRSATRFPE